MSHREREREREKKERKRENVRETDRETVDTFDLQRGNRFSLPKRETLRGEMS